MAVSALNSSSEPNLSGNLRSFHCSWRYDRIFKGKKITPMLSAYKELQELHKKELSS